MMGKKRFFKRALLFFAILIFVTTFNASADNLKINFDSTEDASIHAYYVLNFEDLQYTLGIPYHQIIAKVFKVEEAKDIKFVRFYYPRPGYVSIANIKKMIILDKGEEINNDLVKEMRDQIFSEVIRYYRFLHEKKPTAKYESPGFDKKDEIFIKGVKIFKFKTLWYGNVATGCVTTGYNVAMWIEEGKLLYCTSTFSQDSFLKKYVGNVSSLLKEYKPEVSNKITKEHRKRGLEKYIEEYFKESLDRKRELEYIKGFLETLK